jgi:hypothetical protein
MELDRKKIPRRRPLKMIARKQKQGIDWKVWRKVSSMILEVQTLDRTIWFISPMYFDQLRRLHFADTATKRLVSSAMMIQRGQAPSTRDSQH